MESKARSLNAQVGTAVHALRTHYGFTKAELADRSGVTVAALGQIERGKPSVNIDSLYAIARALEFEELSEFFKLVEVGTDKAALSTYLDEIASTLDELLDEVREPVNDRVIESNMSARSSPRRTEVAASQGEKSRRGLRIRPGNAGRNPR